MIDFSELIPGYYTTLATQFAYLAFFAGYFPLGAFILLLGNLAVVSFSAYAYSHYAKRTVSIKTSSIGIWKKIFNSIGYLGVIYNGLMMIFVGDGLIHIFGTENNLRDAILILAAEHVLIAFKGLISWIMPGIPSWVIRRIQKERYLEERDHEMIINKYKTMEDYQKLKDETGSKALSKMFKTPKIIFNKFSNSEIFGGIKLHSSNLKNSKILESAEISEAESEILDRETILKPTAISESQEMETKPSLKSLNPKNKIEKKMKKKITFTKSVTFKD